MQTIAQHSRLPESKDIQEVMQISAGALLRHEQVQGFVPGFELRRYHQAVTLEFQDQPLLVFRDVITSRLRCRKVCVQSETLRQSVCEDHCRNKLSTAYIVDYGG